MSKKISVENNKADSKIVASKAVCPLCRKFSVHKFRPFCSLECAERDLGLWLDQKYLLKEHDNLYN